MLPPSVCAEGGSCQEKSSPETAGGGIDIALF